MNDDALDRALDALLADRSPRGELEHLDDEQKSMLRMAQLIRGSRPEEADPRFVGSLHDRLFARQARVSRRTAFLSGLGALAAGVLAGVGLDRTMGGHGSAPQAGANGRWVHVASAADLPDGTIKTFTAGAVQGFLMHRGGRYRAVSRICTHMGCRLNYGREERALVCPCHGAEFDLQGTMITGPGGYYTSLPPLPRIPVRLDGDSVQVWTV
jgi:nitrite reductase/ring-hydroxylating ferredoxin subunit